MNCIGIESSCDETSISIVNDKKEILSNVIFSQIEKHASYGGVVPEIASRAHSNLIDIVYEKALSEAQLSIDEIDVIAATSGPGLIGGVIVGSVFGKALSMLTEKPFIAVNHLEAHALTPRLTSSIEFPYLLILVSGGHSEFVEVNGVGKYKKIGGTIDDAFGEAFDKVAKMLGLGYPGGPIIEKIAKTGDENRFNLPRPLFYKKDLNVSLSGLKTAVFREIEKNQLKIDETFKADMAASFQKTVVDIIIKKTEFMLKCYDLKKFGKIVISGGVAANGAIRFGLKKLADKYQVSLDYPPINLCTDNGAMIAWCGIERFRNGLVNQIDFKPRSRWPLEEG